MLEKSFRFDLDESHERRNPYNLELKYDHDWKTSSHRVLIVLQTVDSRDLKAESLLGDPAFAKAFKNSWNYSKKIAKRYNPDLHHSAISIVNFNAYKHLHLPFAARKEAEQVFAERVLKLIKKRKPTHVLMCGDEAMHATFPQVQFPQYKRGWVHKLKVENIQLKVTSTLDFTRLIENNGRYANLLGHWCRHAAWLQLGYLPHDLSQLKNTPKYVNTIEKFNEVMYLFDTAKRCALDTETKNLSVLHNSIYTMQLCFDHNEEVGYVLAIDHPLAHWTKEERLYIKRELRKRFSRKTGPMLITFNGMFDLRVIRQALKIPIIWLKVWEIMFGEHALDENYQLLNRVSFMKDEQSGKLSTFGGLKPVYCSYGNDHYLKASFGKEDRNTTGSIEPDNPEVLEYESADVTSIHGIFHQQLKRAQYEMMHDKVYAPYFKRLMVNQMSDTAHVLSHMRNDGSSIDIEYLKSLLSSTSPLRTELKRAQEELQVFPEVKATNRALLKESGFKAGSLFGNSVKEAWTFKLSKPAHRIKLFIETLNLEPVSTTPTGAPQIDSGFIKFYKDTNKIVSLYGEYQALSKLLSTYVKGWWRKMTTNLDAITDKCLRADYSLVDTSRLRSFDPNLQQIPSRGKLAKIIKRMFVCKKRYLLLRFDYSAHEVRVWSIVSGDKVLASAFKAGQKLRQAFIANPTEENRKAIKEKGDIHILNVLRFFGMLVDKEHPLRDAVKAVVFGVLYGKSAETLGTDTKQGDIQNIRSELGKLFDEREELLNKLKDCD